MNLVSVVIPSYNASQYINEAVQSAIMQTYRTTEIIVIDDGSEDDTRHVLKNYILNGTIKYYYQNNQGPGAARNYGIHKANGKYICFLDSDDTILPDSIEKRVGLIEQHDNVELVFTDLYVFDTPSQNKPEAYLKSRNFTQLFSSCIAHQDDPYFIFNQDYIDNALRYNPFIQTSTVMIKKDVISRVGLFNTGLRAAEDIDLWFRICRLARIGFVDEPLSCWNRYRSGLTKDVFRFLKDSIVYYESMLRNNDLKSSSITLLKHKISQFYFDLGYSYFERGDVKNARQYFLKSIFYDHHRIFINLKCFILSYVPVNILKRIKDIYVRY